MTRNENSYINEIRHNNRAIRKAKELRKKYKIIRASIATCALITSSVGVFMYRNAPANGALFYRSGNNDTEMHQTDATFPHQAEVYETRNGRLITEEGAHKSYTTKVDTENGTEEIKVTLADIASSTSGNSFCSEEVELKNGKKVIVKTIPSSDESLKDGAIISSGLFISSVDLLISEMLINEVNNEESKYKMKNRQLKKRMKMNK